MLLPFCEAAPLIVPTDDVTWEAVPVVVMVDDSAVEAAPDVDEVEEAKTMLVMRESWATIIAV
jgi:hypothetical protein